MTYVIKLSKKAAKQIVSAVLAPLLIATTMPAPGAFAESTTFAPHAVKSQEPKQAPPIHVKTGPHQLRTVHPTVAFSANPTDLEISSARLFSEPLVPMAGAGHEGTNSALASTLLSFHNRADAQDFSALSHFISANPHSKWRPALELNLAVLKYNSGYLTDALALWHSAWEGAKSETASKQVAIANRAVADLMMLEARLGKTEQLQALSNETAKRAFLGSDDQMVHSARTGLWMMRNKPDCAYKCGPYAIDTIVNLHKRKQGTSTFVKKLTSTENGTNLAQVKDWAIQAGLHYQAAKRSPGAPVIVPSIMHWKIGHFAAITEKSGQNYILKDPTFDTDMTIGLAPAALESESDGYFLVPAGSLPSGWQAVTDQEAQKVWGKGGTTGPNPNDQGGGPSGCSAFCSTCSGPQCTSCPTKGMARASWWSMNATVHIVDTPLSYSPPVGPAANFMIAYNQDQSNQPSTFTFTNLGQDWVFNWLSYLTVNSMTQVATVRIRGGGSEVFTQTGGVYTPDILSQALLVSMGGGTYQRQLPDGTIEVFSQADGLGNIFMTKVIDPQGNSALIQYDSNYRITSITDAINQVSTVSYVSNTFGNSGFYNIAAITDPFSRSCSFVYDSTNTYLLSITDSIGLTSKFNYDKSSSFISSMTTPYGSTAFKQYVPGNSGATPAVGLRFTYSDGTSSVIENWAGFTNNSYYWDREATMSYPNDPTMQNYTHCQTIKWLEEVTPALEGAVPYIVTNALESQSPVTYSYLNQVNPESTGTINKPILVTRPLSGETMLATIGGTITAGDVISIIVNDSTIGAHTYSYTILSTDTTSTAAQGLSNVMNAYSANAAISFVSAAEANVISMSTTEPSSVIDYGRSVTGAATETISLTSQTKQTEAITVLGPIVTGDVVNLKFGIPLYPGFGNHTVSYTVPGSSTTTTVAAGMAAAINADTTLQAIPITATSSGAVINVVSFASADTTYNYSSVDTYLGFGPISNGSTQNYQYQYNSIGKTTQSIDPVNRTFTYAYATNGIDLTQITETQLTDNFQIGAWTYNSYHRPLTYTDGSGQVTHYTYNSSGELTSITDANSNVTTLTYTGTGSATIGGTKTTGNVLTITTHDIGLTGGQEADSYTVLSGDTLTTIAAGLTAAINADTHLQAIGVSATSAGTTITLTSTSVNVTSYTESTSGGATETITLGATNFGYLTKIDGPLTGSNDITTFTYDSVGRLATQTDSEGYTLSFAYDNADRPTQTTYPDGTTEQTTYDRLDAVLKKDRIGRWTQDSFDELDQLAFEIDPLGRKTQYQWCACGSLAALTDPNGHVTTWHHDLQGRTISKTYADQTSVNYAYEPYTSRLRSKTDALGQTTTYAYGVDNTPYLVGYRNAVNATSPVVYNFDPNYRRITSIQKNDWGTISYTYNPYIVPLGTPTTGGGMLQKVHNNVIANSDITYVYDVLGRTTNRSINASSNSTTWTYDAMSRITAEANALGSFGYSYVDNVSGSSKGTLRLSSISYPNSQTTNFNWYPNIGDQRLQQISNLNPSGGTLSQFNYGYDSAGEITQWQQQQNGNNLFYNLGYDLAGQLTSAQAGSGAPQPPYAKENYYAYDAGANRTAVQNTSLQTVRVAGTKTTGDTLTLTVHDSALSGGQEAVTYTVLSGDTLPSIALGLATAVNTDTHLQALGVIANAHGTNSFINVRSASNNITTYTESTSSGATETLTFGIFKNGIENATISGAKHTGDILTITVHDPALTGGQEAVNYTVLAADTLTTIATALKTAINADAHLSTLGVTATSAATVDSISSNSTNATTYTESLSGSATETITLTTNTNVNAVAVVNGTKTTGDVLTLTTYDAGLSGGLSAVTYTVLSGDTLTTIASGLAAAVNASTSLQAIGVSATVSGRYVTIQSNSTNSTTYRQSYSTSATESISITTPTYGWQEATIGGTKTTGNILTITVFDSDLAGGKEAVNYTVLSTDTLTSIATAIAAAINADANLQAINVSASSSSTVVSIESLSPNLTTYAQSTSSGATETIALGTSTGVMQAAYNEVNELTALAPGGATRFQGTTDKPVQSASFNSQVVSISSTPTIAASSTFSPSATSTGTETLTFVDNGAGYAYGKSTKLTIGGTAKAGDTIYITVYEVRLLGGSHTISYKVQSGDTTTSIATAFFNIIDADPILSFEGLAYAFQQTANVLYISDSSQTATGNNSEAFSSSVIGGATETVSLSYTPDQNYNATIGGTVTTGDVVSVTADNSSLSGGQETASYTVLSGDTLTSIATGLKSAINADSNLAAIGVGATSTGAVVSIVTDTYYTTSTSGGATETITLGTTTRGSTTVTIGGKPTTSDTLTITAHNQLLSGGAQSVTYTVLSTDTLLTIANGLAAAINASTPLATLGVTSPTDAATLAFSQGFSGNAQLPVSASTASATATDGGSNVKTNGIQLSVANGTSSALTYDLNGNMTSDGTNSYSWDAANRMIQITYSGTNNFSSFVYDGKGRNVSIVETVAGSVTSTKQFVWIGRERREARNSGSSITAQYFALGETVSGTSYFYTEDHLGSTREMTNSSGVIQDQRAYDAYGRVSQLQGSMSADFQYAGYYVHSRTGLSLTLFRPYNASIGEWFSRDPMDDVANLYTYVANEPLAHTDSLGLAMDGGGGGGGIFCSRGPAKYCRGLACCQKWQNKCLSMCDYLWDEGVITSYEQYRRCRRCCRHSYDACKNAVTSNPPHQYDIDNFRHCWEGAVAGTLGDDY